MRLVRTPHFLRAYTKAPQTIQHAFDKQARLLLSNLSHPSLRAKKYDESRTSGKGASPGVGVLIFTIEGDTYALHEIKSHPK